MEVNNFAVPLTVRDSNIGENKLNCHRFICSSVKTLNATLSDKLHKV